MKNYDLIPAPEAVRTGTARPMLEAGARPINRAVEGTCPDKVPDGLADEEGEMTSIKAAVRATLAQARHDAPLAEDELACILDRVHSVRLMPRSDRQIGRFVAGHLTVPNVDGRMLVVTRAPGAMLWNNVGTLLEAFPELRPAAPARIPVVDIRVAVGSGEHAVGTAMLNALGATKHPSCEYEVWKDVRQHLAYKNTRVIHWDLQGPQDLARGRWFNVMESLVLNCLVPYGFGRLFICTGPWSARQIFPGVRVVREAAAIVDSTSSYDASDLLVDAIEEMAAVAGLSVAADVRKTVVPSLLRGRSPKARLRCMANAIARALAPVNGAGERLAPCQALRASHFRRAASTTAVDSAASITS